VVYSGDNYDRFGWAVFMAGGSMAVLPPLPDDFLCDAASMTMQSGNGNKQWRLSNGKGFIIYSASTEPIRFNLQSGTIKVNWIDPATGKFLFPEQVVMGGRVQEFTVPQTDVVLWIRTK